MWSKEFLAFIGLNHELLDKNNKLSWSQWWCTRGHFYSFRNFSGSPIVPLLKNSKRNLFLETLHKLILDLAFFCTFLFFYKIVSTFVFLNNGSFLGNFLEQRASWRFCTTNLHHIILLLTFCMHVTFIY